MYHSVQNFPTCENAINPKFRWQEGDPVDGVDVDVWKQHSEEMSSDSGCHGIFTNYNKRDGGRCYTYEILVRMCMLIAFKEYPETASYGWQYNGGCYQDGAIGVYEKAEIGRTYDFTFVPIEVREDESLLGGLSVGGGGGGGAAASGGSFFGSLSSFFFILALLSGVVFGALFFKAWKSMQAGSAE